jgi:hypothetical protein
MVREDVGGLWDFFRQIPLEEKMYLREDVDNKEEVERWARNLDYDTVLPILAFSEGRMVGDATLHRNRPAGSSASARSGSSSRQDFRYRGLGTAMVRELRHLGRRPLTTCCRGDRGAEGGDPGLREAGVQRMVIYRNYVNDQRAVCTTSWSCSTLSLSEDAEFLRGDICLKFTGLPSDRGCEGFVDHQPISRRGACSWPPLFFDSRADAAGLNIIWSGEGFSPRGRDNV